MIIPGSACLLASGENASASIGAAIYRVSRTNRKPALSHGAKTSNEKCRVGVAFPVGEKTYHFSFRGCVLHANGGETRKILPLATTELHQKCKSAEKFFRLKCKGFPSCNRQVAVLFAVLAWNAVSVSQTTSAPPQATFKPSCFCPEASK